MPNINYRNEQAGRTEAHIFYLAWGAMCKEVWMGVGRSTWANINRLVRSTGFGSLLLAIHHLNISAVLFRELNFNQIYGGH